MSVAVFPVKPTLVIIIPCYNEEEVLPESAKTLSGKITQLVSAQLVSEKSTLLFVDDGSTDNTWALIEKYHRENPLVFNGIKLSGNRGHQNTLLCGLLSVKDYADAAVSMDADLQDDIDVIDKMLECRNAGAEIVFGVRLDRKADGFFKRMSACFFYGFMRFLGVELVTNHADFRLMGKKAVNALSEYNEVNLFLRGIVPMLGFKTGTVHYTRKKRTAGKGKYGLRKMTGLAFDGITSFSIKPLRLITLLGLALFAISIIMTIYYITGHFSGQAVSAWAGLICSIWGIGGLTIFSAGIVGEYVGKIYTETKQRPRYHIEQFLFGPFGQRSFKQGEKRDAQ